MAADKKEYETVLAALLSHATLPNIINKLTKVWVSTENEKFKKALGTIITHLKDAARNQTKKSQVVSINISLQPYAPLAEYCHKCIASAKPQWQIIAEQNGWGPKSGS